MQMRNFQPTKRDLRKTEEKVSLMASDCALSSIYHYSGLYLSLKKLGGVITDTDKVIHYNQFV